MCEMLVVVVGNLLEKNAPEVISSEEIYLKQLIEIESEDGDNKMVVPIVAKDYIAEQIMRDYQAGDKIHFIGIPVEVSQRVGDICVPGLGYKALYIDSKQELMKRVGSTIEDFISA